MIVHSLRKAYAYQTLVSKISKDFKEGFAESELRKKKIIEEQAKELERRLKEREEESNKLKEESSTAENTDDTENNIEEE